MGKLKLVYIFFLVILNLPIVVFAQPEGAIDMENEMEEIDQEEIDPVIKMWYSKGYSAFRDSISLDTLQDYFHLFHPVYEDAITATFVGNYGTPHLNNNFFKRKSKTDFFFLQTRDAYLLRPSKTKYYNTRTPYTLLDYSQSENKNKKNETRFNVLHTQNVNPYWNFTFRYDQARSDGQYKQQAAKNNFATLYSSYNKDKLSVHAGFVNNSLQNRENGGLKNDQDIFNGEDTEFLDVNLNSSQSLFNSAYFYADAEYRLGRYLETDSIEQPEVFKPLLGIIYSVEYQRHKQEFIDEEDTTNLFFANTYYGHDYLKDSIRFNKIRNVVQLKQYENTNRKTSFGKRAFLGQEFVKASSPGPISDKFNRQTKKFSNVYAGGGIFREMGNFWTWNFEGRIFLLGRNAGQTELSGVISKPLSIFGDSLAMFSVNGSLENLVADYFQEEFYSNHFRWKNDFKMEQRMTVEGNFKLPKYKFEAGANYAIINNFIYNDTLGIPAQTNKELLILAAYLDKDFSTRNAHFRTRLLWQKASNEDFIHLPDLSVFVSAYYKFVISKVLFTQIGVDMRYNTAYYADQYAPTTGLFYIQNEKKVGNYPFIDAYASLRLKRTRLFFKLMNVGTSFLDGEYYTTPYYPMNRMTFRLGVAWAFYD